MRIKKTLHEVVSIKNGSLRGANAESELDKSKRTHHPYHWAAGAFARARTVHDWEQVPEQSDAQCNRKLEKIDTEANLRRYIAHTIEYSGKKYW